MGAIRRLFWDEWNEEHIARHGVTPQEVEEVCFSRHWMLRASGRRRKAVFGQTVSGRYLLVILEMGDYGEYDVITARDMTLAEHRRFQWWRGER